jgi:hypothetical protein
MKSDPFPHTSVNLRKRRKMRQRMVVEIDEKVLREFKSEAVRKGKKLWEEIERLMREELRRKDGNKVRNSRVG